MPGQKLAYATGALAAGNLAASEIVCRDILDVEPQNSAALTLLGTIAAKVGALDFSAAYFREALSADPNNVEASRNLEILNNAPPHRNDETRGELYLVIKSWGAGFWSDVSQVLGSLLLAEITGRMPITHWGNASLFSDGSNRDAFEFYFKPISNITLQDLARIESPTFFPPKWNTVNLSLDDRGKWHESRLRGAALYFLHRPERIVVNDFYAGVVNVMPWVPSVHPMHKKPLEAIYRYLLDKYLFPHSATHSACDAFFQAHLKGAPFVAVHIRGSDKTIEDQNLEATNQTIYSTLTSIDPKWRIFLLTDDEHWCARTKAAYGDRVITTNSRRTSTTTGVHRLPSVNRVQAGLEVMIDAYLALRADQFIGNGSSNVSAMIAVLKEWQAGQCTLIGRSRLLERHLNLHIK